jgi:hypothetical protein
MWLLYGVVFVRCGFSNGVVFVWCGFEWTPPCNTLNPEKKLCCLLIYINIIISLNLGVSNVLPSLQLVMGPNWDPMDLQQSPWLIQSLSCLDLVLIGSDASGTNVLLLEAGVSSMTTRLYSKLPTGKESCLGADSTSALPFCL